MKLQLEELESRFAPVVHSFSAATTHTDQPNAGGTPANAVVREALGGIPAPVVATAGNAQGVPFATNSVPGR